MEKSVTCLHHHVGADAKALCIFVALFPGTKQAYKVHTLYFFSKGWQIPRESFHYVLPTRNVGIQGTR
jgi:hypothetical protein